jgi:mannosyl-3-phosphoglycerate phosphatase
LNNKAFKQIVFSDLDGTLLNEKYSLADVLPMVARLVALNVPIVLCSSKTRKEIEYYRKRLGIDTPFITENGAAIFFPKGKFKAKNFWTKQTDQYDIIEIGLPYSSIRKELEDIKKKLPYKITGFGDMTVEEIAKDTGLTIELAELAKQREYSEPIIYNGQQKSLCAIALKKGLRITKGGKYFTLSGEHDKGIAVSCLKELYSAEFEQLRTIGIGNGCNDIEMLEAVEEPFFIKDSQEIKQVWEKIVSQVSNLLVGNCQSQSKFFR